MADTYPLQRRIAELEAACNKAADALAEVYAVCAQEIASAATLDQMVAVMSDLERASRRKG